MKETCQNSSFETLLPLVIDTLKRGDSITFTANGNSMHPYIQGGKHRVTLSPINDSVKKNDVIFYRRDNGVFVLHRVIRIHSDGTYDFCGDRQFKIESGICSHQLIAKMTYVQRNGKIISADSFASRIWCLFLPILRFTYRLGSKIKHLI